MSRVGEILERLVKADNYIEERVKVSDELIDMAKCCLPSHYVYIKEKEEAYQGILKLLQGETK